MRMLLAHSLALRFSSIYIYIVYKTAKLAQAHTRKVHIGFLNIIFYIYHERTVEMIYELVI